jgi:hypothetical protein
VSFSLTFVVTEYQIVHATALREAGATVAATVVKTGLTRSTLYRHLPPRAGSITASPAPAPPVLAAGDHTEATAAEPEPVSAVPAVRVGDRLARPTCGHRPTTRSEAILHLDDPATLRPHLDTADGVEERRHSVKCQPREQVLSLTCDRRGAVPRATLGAGCRRRSAHHLEEVG